MDETVGHDGLEYSFVLYIQDRLIPLHQYTNCLCVYYNLCQCIRIFKTISDHIDWSFLYVLLRGISLYRFCLTESCNVFILYGTHCSYNVYSVKRVTTFIMLTGNHLFFQWFFALYYFFFSLQFYIIVVFCLQVFRLPEFLDQKDLDENIINLYWFNISSYLWSRNY